MQVQYIMFVKGAAAEKVICVNLISDRHVFLSIWKTEYETDLVTSFLLAVLGSVSRHIFNVQ